MGPVALSGTNAARRCLPRRFSVPDQEDQERQPAAQASISLAQAVLAPLDAIFKAQLHAGRSFLNMLLQLGYPARPPGSEPPKDPVTGEILPDRPYTMDFLHVVEDSGELKRRKLSIPALSLVPVAPLAVRGASFKFDMAVKKVDRSTLVTAGNKPVETQDTRPWFLVHEPLDIKGAIAPPATEVGAGGERRSEQTIHIELQVEQMKVPAGLDRLLTSLTQLASFRDLPPLPATPPSAPSPPPAEPSPAELPPTEPPPEPREP
jgi:hypothetical protein